MNYLYVDNSNVWIEGMHVSAVQTGLAPDIWTAQTEKICDYGWKIDFGRLFEFAVTSGTLYGRSSPVDRRDRRRIPLCSPLAKRGRPGQTRRLGIPTVVDRVVMTAAQVVLEPIFEADFHPCSFGLRPKRSAHQALEVIRTTANRGADWVLDTDIAACFAIGRYVFTLPADLSAPAQ
jgi:hypothetical protein